MLRIRKDRIKEFEQLFEAEELPLWDEFTESGKFQIARLARGRVRHGGGGAPGLAMYPLYVEVTSMVEHFEHDRDPRFEAYLAKVLPLHAEPPSVFGGNILFERRAT